jgi:hypothetical protein
LDKKFPYSRTADLRLKAATMASATDNSAAEIPAADPLPKSDPTRLLSTGHGPETNFPIEIVLELRPVPRIDVSVINGTAM